MAQALIQQRFYVGVGRRSYVHGAVSALLDLSGKLYAAWLDLGWRLRMSPGSAARGRKPTWQHDKRLPSARDRSSARHAAEHSGFACCAHVLRLRTFVVAQGFAS
ncbi:hypothetical protein WG8_0845 [Paenibacillus sp. Aloe-11]|nr:hypothetical protein WG8_0845 [Paenibacillus sp. Aloe-11]